MTLKALLKEPIQGYHFSVATNPWSHHVLGDLIPEDEGGNATNKYRNYWGYEVDLLKELAKVIKFLRDDSFLLLL